MSSKSSPTGSTPNVKTSGFTSTSTQNTPVVQQQQQQQQQDANASDASITQFPPPQTFDIIPSLHALLDRLISAQNKNNNAGDSTAGGPTESVSGGGGAGDGLTTGSLDPKVLVTEASAIKIRIQKARAAVEGLPDIDRTVDQQEEEMAELERRIERLKEIIGDFGQKSTRAMNGGGIVG